MAKSRRTSLARPRAGIRLTRAPQRSNRFRSLSALAAVLLFLGGCGEEEVDVSPSYEDRIPLGVEVDASDRLITWGDTTAVRGLLTQGKEELDGETVVLEADSYPFDREYAEVESAQTRDGRFEFEVEPDANTAYRVAAGEHSEATSRPVRVYVNPRTEVEEVDTGSGTRFELVFSHPKERSIAGSNVFNYAAPAAQAQATGRLGFIRVKRVEERRPGTSAASVVVPFTGDVSYSTCVSYTPDAGVGDPNPRCVQSSIPAG